MFFGDPDCETCEHHKNEIDAWREGRHASRARPVEGQRYALEVREEIKRHCRDYLEHCRTKHRQRSEHICNGLCPQE